MRREGIAVCSEKDRSREQEGDGGPDIEEEEEIVSNCCINIRIMLCIQKRINHSFNAAVVSELNGCTFGFGGLSGDDDGTLDTIRIMSCWPWALLLGEVNATLMKKT
mmetsp:Transcript_26882/g.48481  ORF Transcript_26882/g.48481 Transcript_26882/m.48481 type:complete len:107 (+) Transcript_26882:556-876(+)